MKKFIATIVISILALSATSALAATSTPTPKPTAKTSAKPAAEASAQATKKPDAKKKPVKKKPVKKKKKLPPLQPVLCFGKNWPPSGFTQNGEVFARIPTAAQLQCETSDNFAPSKVILRSDISK